MYNALVMLYFNYCSAVWGDINIKKLADKLQKMQNRAARILTFSSYDVRSMTGEITRLRLEISAKKNVVETLNSYFFSGRE